MTLPFKIFGLASTAALLYSSSALAQSTYNGDGATGFGGPVGKGVLTFTSNGTTLTGTINQGNLPSGFNDELVIYINDKAGGFTTTSTFTDTGTGGDTLRGAVSGLSNGANGATVVRAPLNFAPGFGADYAIALSPAKAQFGALYTLDNVANFTYGSNGTNGSANLTPTGTNTAATYTFSIPLSLIGSPTSFQFATTYLDGAGAYRSNEAFGNTITDVANGSNTGNLGQDTGLIGYSAFPVPEPHTWVLSVGGLVTLLALRRSQRHA